MADLIYNSFEAKSSLSWLLERAATGEEIVIAKAGKPRAKLVPIAKAGTPRQPGGWEGRVLIADDIDEPLPDDIVAAFEGQG